MEFHISSWWGGAKLRNSWY